MSEPKVGLKEQPQIPSHGRIPDSGEPKLPIRLPADPRIVAVAQFEDWLKKAKLK